MTNTKEMQKLLGKNVAERTRISGTMITQPFKIEGVNYMSDLYTATTTTDQGHLFKLFGKVVNVHENLRQVLSIKSCYETEQYFYGKLAKAYEEIQDGHKLKPKHRYSFPKYYGGTSIEREETVLLEDLSEKGYRPYNRLKPIDWEHAVVAVTSLARFHALSFAFAKEKPDKFNEAREKLKYRRKEINNACKKAFIKMMENAVSVAKEEHKEKLKKLLLSDSTIEETHKIKLPLSTPVFCHGSYKINNMLFKQSDERLEAIVVDYQLVVPGCPVTDLLYFEFLGTDEEFRRENHEKLINHYYTELTLALIRLDMDVDDVYPRETFDSELKQMLPTALLVSSYTLPWLLVGQDRAPKFREAVSVKDLIIPPNELFAERFSGIVSDCVRWGVI